MKIGVCSLGNDMVTRVVNNVGSGCGDGHVDAPRDGSVLIMEVNDDSD